MTRERRTARAAFTLVELVVAMTLLGLVAGGLIRIVAGQQRFYRSAGELMDSRSQIRQAVTLLPADLRGLSASGGDILEAGDAAISIMATIGSSAACALTPASVTIPPQGLESGQTITAVRTTPEPGDVLMVFDDGATPGRDDDRWQRYTIIARTRPPRACRAPFVSPRDSGSGFVLDVSPAVSTTIREGAPIRFLRRVHYELYHASDGRWHLGYAECPADKCGTLQPVSGPYRDYLAPNHPSNGLRFRYFNAAAELAASQLAGAGNQARRNAITRIQITVRGATANPLGIPGLPSERREDEVVIQVALRNAH